MKHAGAHALTSLTALLGDIRNRNGLVERKPGVFYRKSKAFIHFHEDADGLFMDIRDGSEWRRLAVGEHAQCLDKIDAVLAKK